MQRTNRIVVGFVGALLGLAVLGLAFAGAPGKGKAEQGKKPMVEIRTNVGTMVVELWPDKAPKTVENFLRYAREGFYDGTIFHRVVPGFVIQGGGYTKDRKEKPTHDPIPLEANASNRRYTIAMARTNDPNSATSQFYINLIDNLALDAGRRSPGYAVFGRVVKGQDVVDRIGKAETVNAGGAFTNLPAPPIVIEKVTILEQ